MPWPRCSGSTKRSSSQMPACPVHVEKLPEPQRHADDRALPHGHEAVCRGVAVVGEECRLELGRGRRRCLGLALVGGERPHEADEVGDVGGRGLADLEVGHAPILAPAAPVAQPSAGSGASGTAGVRTRRTDCGSGRRRACAWLASAVGAAT